jgi:hypothetical protein
VSASPDTSAPSDGRGEPIVSEALRERWRRKEEEFDSRDDVRETPGGDRGDVGVCSPPPPPPSSASGVVFSSSANS